jgi:hypothetical protein
MPTLRNDPFRSKIYDAIGDRSDENDNVSFI